MLHEYMSGHSHWAGIKHRKGINDAKRAKIFTKHGKLITIAAREGGGKPESNLKLKLAVEQARAANMPNVNIERAIKRGTGELKDQAEIQEMIYEAYGSGGIMMIIKTVTDNKNRTVSEIKSILSDFGGKLGGPGSVMWNFEKAEMELKPKNILEINEEVRAQYEKLLEALDEQDDVEEIFDNL
jgi:YebC/PmpR family DNA-binding regulatory protein